METTRVDRRTPPRDRHAPRYERPRAGKGNSEMVNDGKFICKRFFSNFEKLKREVESEEAFFFNDDGVYCQVGTSIFDRWEQVTLIDPEWCERGVPRCLHAIEATRVHQTRSWVL